MSNKNTYTKSEPPEKESDGSFLLLGGFESTANP